MRVRVLVFMCALISYDVQTYTTSKDSGEQSAIQEALLLVELLKSEYTRSLRKNSNIKENDVDEIDLPTCATTTALRRKIENLQVRKTLKPYTTYGPRRSYHPEYFSRRRFSSYRDYYGNYSPPKSFRRMDYENQTLLNSTINKSTTVSVPGIATSSVLTTTSTTASPMTTLNTSLHTSSSSTIRPTVVSSTTSKPVTVPLITLKPTQLSISTISLSTTLRTSILSTTLSTTLLNKKQPTLTSKYILSGPGMMNNVNNKKKRTNTHTLSEKVNLVQKKLYLTAEKTTVISTNENPEQAQAAAELENELEASIDSSTILPSSLRWPIKWRSSTRVHLAKSTPYHLPLPENHAFCYTNPRSSLCRTFIK